MLYTPIIVIIIIIIIIIIIGYDPVAFISSTTATLSKTASYARHIVHMDCWMFVKIVAANVRVTKKLPPCN